MYSTVGVTPDVNDPRLQSDAYISYNGELFRVIGPHRDGVDIVPGMYELENAHGEWSAAGCYIYACKVVSAQMIVRWYSIVRHAPPVEVPQHLVEQMAVPSGL